MDKWDKYFFSLCAANAAMSKDPSTKVGAVIVRPNRTVVSMGWNGFPRHVDDDPKVYADRPRKLMRTVHAELNAILTANQPVLGCTLYVSPLFPCASCAAVIIQAGILRVVATMPKPNPAWYDSFNEAKAMFREARVVFEIMEE